jgi:hypothetical protein
MAMSSGTGSGPLALVSEFRAWSSSPGTLHATNMPVPAESSSSAAIHPIWPGVRPPCELFLLGIIYPVGFRSEQHIKIASEPARVISEKYAMERVTQIRMDI